MNREGSFNDVHIEQPYNTLHVDLFNSIYQMSNNEKITLPKDIDLTDIISSDHLETVKLGRIVYYCCQLKLLKSFVDDGSIVPLQVLQLL